MSKSGEDDGGREGVDKEWREGKIEAILDPGCNSNLCWL